MWKQKNRLYSNPANAKSFPKWTIATMVQPFKFEDRKVMLEAIVYPENLFLNFSEINEKNATRLLWKIKNKLQSNLKDLPTISEWEEKNSFLHNAFSVIVFSYCAIETYINSSIEKYKIDKWKWRKSLQEKINLVLDNFKINNIKEFNSQLWNNFLELEELRDKIIHSKYSCYNIWDPFRSDLLISKIFNWKFKEKTIVAYNIIKYFRDNEPEIPKIKNKSDKEYKYNIEWWRWLQSNPI